MKQYGLIEKLVTKYLLLSILGTLVLVIGLSLAVLLLGYTDLPTLSTFVDMAFKTVAVLVGAIWALNRYFVGRLDLPQLRVDADIQVVPTKSGTNDPLDVTLLIFRLDVVNTGKTLITGYNQYVEVTAVTPSARGIQHKLLYNHSSPNVRLHIEPGSWAAVNDELVIPGNVKVVRLYHSVQLSEDEASTWHKTFAITKEGVNG